MSAVAKPETLPAPSGRSGARSAAALGAVGTGFLAALCCLGPLIFVTFGVGAGLASTFKPLQTPFTVLTLVLLVIGFYVVYGPRARAADRACATNAACAAPGKRRRDVIMLWVGTILALALVTFPKWSLLLV